MKPKEKKPEIVYRIISSETGEPVGSYSRAYCDEFDFNSVRDAREANCHGAFKDKDKYKIAKYRVTYELIDDDLDPISEEDLIVKEMTPEEKMLPKMVSEIYDKFEEELLIWWESKQNIKKQ